MAIAFDAVTKGFIGTAASGSFNHTCTGSNLYLFVLTGPFITSVTYNSVAMALLTSYVPLPGPPSVKVWGLANPATGTHAVAVTNTSNPYEENPVAVSYSGVDSTQPEAYNTTDGGSSSSYIGSITNTVTTLTDNAWLSMFVRGNNNFGRNFTAGASTTLRQTGACSLSADADGVFDSGGVKSPAGSYSLAANWSSSTGRMASVIYSLKPYLTFSFTGPSSGNVNSASTNFTVTPDIAVTGTVTITPTGAGSAGLSPTVLTFSNSAVAQTFTITPLTSGSITLTMTNGCGLNNPTPLTYTAIAVVPGAPTIGTATPGNTNASITFSAPTFDGGSPITLYTATSTPGTFTGTSATSPITVTGLSNGTPYTFKVKATNSVGTGPESSASNSATPYVPATTFTFTGPSGGSVRSASTNFTVTPNAVYYGTITLTPTGAAAAGLNPIVLTWSGTSTVQTFTITPLASGVITLVPTNSNGLANPSNLTYTANAVVSLPPPIGLAVPSQSSAFITVSAPTNDGGSAILYYTVTSSPGGKTGISPTPGQITVNGLTNGTIYTFTATATNSIGTSSASSASNAVVPIEASVAFANNGPKFTTTRDVGNILSF